MSKNKKNKIILSIILISMCLLLTIASLFKAPTMAAAKTYEREYLQETVIATALSYLYNNSYSDYGQTAMDSAYPRGIKVGDTTQTKVSLPTTQNWRTFAHTPEMASRSNYYYIDCSSFAISTYLHSLGYDFSEYYKYSMHWNTVLEENEERQPVRYFWETSYASSQYSKSQMNNAKQFGKAYNTGFFHAIASDKVSSTEGKPYINKSDSNSPIAFYYKVTDNETETEIKEIKKSLKENLQIGDMIIYQNKTKDSSGNIKKIAGHVLIYVGDIGLTGVNGVIHATGSDYVVDGDEVTIGSDDFSVRYDPYSYVTGHIFQESTTTEGWTKTSNQITVFRPLNRLCEDDGDDDPSNDKCTLKNSSNESVNLSANAEARRDLAALRVEQYVREQKEFKDDTTSTITNKEILKSISEYNSVNKGDYITYSLYLDNQANYGACNAWGYHDKESCEAKGYTWLNSKREDDYSGITIKAPIPTNTTFTSGDIEIICNGKSDDTSCVTTTEDIDNSNITFKINNLTKKDRITIRYKVKVNTDIDGTTTITHTGMKITTPNKKTLTLAKLETPVNPTLNGINTVLMDKASKNFSTTITDTTDAEDEFAHSLYKEQVGIELPTLNVNNLKKALFTVPETITFKSEKYENLQRFYLKNRTEPTDEDLKMIYKMQVPSFYGGRHVRSDKNTNRIHYISTHYLEIGDILCEIKDNKLKIYIYFGLDENKEAIVKRYDPTTKKVITYDTNSSPTGWKIIKSLHAADIFTVLRPTRNYGTTINLDYNGGTEARESFVTAGTYNFLPTKVTAPTKNYTVTYNYNGATVSTSAKTSETTPNEFKYWKNPSGSKITNTSTLASTQYHTVTASYAGKSITLPNENVTGYQLSGWYTSSSLTTSVGKPNSSYSPTKNITLYAKWTPSTYKVKYNSTCTIEDSSHTYDVSKKLTKNTCTKTGYIFQGWSKTEGGSVEFTDEQSIKNLTDTNGATINLYAVWTPSTYKVKYNSTCTIEDSSHTYDVSKKLTKNTCTKTGYIFQGWSKTEGGSVEFTDEQSIKNLTNTNNGTMNLYAVWKLKTYTLTFDSNGGAGDMPSKTQEYGVAQTLPSNTFTKEYYKFKEWNTKADGSGKKFEDKGTLTLTGNATIYAIWEPITYEVKYNSTCTIENSTHTHNIAKKLTEHTCTKTGYTFKGWSTEEKGNVEYTNKQEVQNLTKKDKDIINLYAVWENNTYYIDFKANDGTTKNSRQVLKYDEETTLKPNSFERTGYIFKGWSDEQVGDVIYEDQQQVINLTSENQKDIILYAVWEETKVTVTFHANDGTGFNLPLEVNYGTFLQLNVLEKSFNNLGYQIAGWNTKPDYSGTDYSATGRINIFNDITLYAKWEPIEYWISYKFNNSCVDYNLTIKYDENYELENPKESCSNRGYKFIGWSTEENGEIVYQPKAVVTKLTTKNLGIIELYANWAPIEYTIKYNSTCKMEDSTYTYNDDKKLTKHTCTKTGYTFEGWSTEENGEVKYKDQQSVNSLTQESNKTINLYAVWKPITYTLKYDANGGTGYEIPEQKLTSGDGTKAIKNPFTKENYTFQGWSSSKDGEVEYLEEEVLSLSPDPDEVITLYAIWKLNEYSLKYDYQNDDNNEEEKIKHGDVIAVKENKVNKVGYKFIRWNTKSDGTGKSYQPGDQLNATSNITLYAQWEKISLVVKYNGNGADNQPEEMKSTAVNENESLTLIENHFTKTGYKFEGWSTKENGDLVYKDKETITVTEDLNLYAVWKPNTYQVKFDANGGTGSMENQTLTYDNKTKITENTYKNNGYIFLYWNTKKDGTGKSYNNQAEVLNLITEGTITLYAQWKSNFSYEIKNYKVNEVNKYIDQVPIHTTHSNYKKNIILGDGYSVSITSNNKNYIATGSKTKIYNSNQTFTYTNIVRGEVTGDGDLDFLDYVTVYNHIYKTINPSSNKKLLKNEYLVAADMSGDGEVDFLDYVHIYNKIKDLR